MSDIICYNSDCDYWSYDVCPIDKTNCSVHDAEELAEGCCKDFETEGDE